MIAQRLPRSPRRLLLGPRLVLIAQTLALVVTASIGGNIVQRTGRYKPLMLIGLGVRSFKYMLMGTMGVTSALLD